MSADDLRDGGSGVMEEIPGAEAASPLSDSDVAPSGDAPNDGLDGCDLAAVLEALLFVSSEPVPLARLASAVGNVSKAEVEEALKRLEMCGGKFEMMQTSFFLSRQTLLASEKPGMAIWREKLFAWMMRNAATPMEFFRLPTNRVVELGSQVEI